MNKAIKELYNNMNDKELYKQAQYLEYYSNDPYNEVSFEEYLAILKQRNYCLALRKSLKLVKQK